MVILVDGHSIAFRAFYALPDSLVTKEGFPTNVIHGFLMMISKIIKDFDTDKLIKQMYFIQKEEFQKLRDLVKQSLKKNIKFQLLNTLNI